MSARLPPYWKQDSKELPDPAFNYSGTTSVIPKGSSERIYPQLNVGETGLISIIDTPTLTPAHDGLFYIARTAEANYQINTLASRQVALTSNADIVLIENKGTTNEKYKWGIIHLI